MEWKVIVPKRVQKQIRKFPQKITERILKSLREFYKNPYFGDVKKIKEEKNFWRRRIGDYRILYEIHSDKKLVIIDNIKRRTTTTYTYRKR